jgi:hypothetical protein
MTTSDNQTDHIVQHILYLEQSLLSPSVRRDRDRVAALLADDFLEFGISGKIWTRDQALEMLGKEDPTSTASTPAVQDLKCTFISDSVVLVTYKTQRTNSVTGKSSVTLRCSLWAMRMGIWQLRFHQGTPVL